MGNSIEEVNVVENYGNMFVFEVDDVISGIYTVVPENTEGRTREAETTFYMENGQFKLSIDNNDEIDRGYIQYSLNNRISCQYSYDLSGNIDLYFNYDNYTNPKFKSLDMYRNSFLHLNKDNTEGLLAIAAEYKEKYEMPGAYYLIKYKSDVKPKFNLRKLTYAEKTKWLYDRSHNYNTDDLIDYIEDDQYMRIEDDDDDIEVSEKDFIDNDNLHLAGGNVIDFSIPIDPEDEESQEQIDEYLYCYLTCEITQNSQITGDVGITDAMRCPITAKLKWEDQYVGGMIVKTITGYTTAIQNNSSLSFNPIYLDFGSILLPDFEYASGKTIDLQVNDMTIMHKVIPATYSLNSDKKYDITATANFSDSTQYVTFEDETTKMVGGRYKKYGVYIIVNAEGTITGTLDSLAERVNKQVYHTETGSEHAFGPEAEPKEEPEPKPVDPEDPEEEDEDDTEVPQTGYVVSLDFDIKNKNSESGLTKLFRVHDITGMSLSTQGVTQQTTTDSSLNNSSEISKYKKTIQTIENKETEIINKYGLQSSASVFGTTVDTTDITSNSKALNEFNTWIEQNYSSELAAVKAERKANGLGTSKSSLNYGDLIINYYYSGVSNATADAKLNSYKVVEGTYGITYIKEGGTVSCGYCGISGGSTVVNTGIGYDVINIKSAIFGQGSSKPYMYMPASVNDFSSKYLNFAYSSVTSGTQFTKMDVFTNQSRSTTVNSVELKSNLDFADIPTGHHATTAFVKSNTDLKLNTTKGLYCYDIKLQSGNFTASSAWYFGTDTVDLTTDSNKTNRTSSDYGFHHNTLTDKTFEEAMFNSVTRGNTKTSSGSYGIYQPWQICKIKYNYYKGSTYFSKYDSGLTFISCGYGSSGHQIYVIQPQFTPALDNNGDICKVEYEGKVKQSDGTCKTVKGVKTDLPKSKAPFNDLQCIEFSSKASNLTSFFQQNRIRCIFITKGYYAWNKTTYNGSTSYTYRRVSTSGGFSDYQLYVLNVVYASQPSNVIIQVPVNVLNCGGIEKIDGNYTTYSWMSNIELPDFTDIVNYQESSGNIPESKEVNVYDFMAQGGYVIKDVIRNARVDSSRNKVTEAWYKAKVSVPPVQGITFVCTNSDSDIIGQGNNAHPLLIGTENGLYKLDFEGNLTKVVESGTVKRIVKVYMGDKYAYLCLFTSGTLMSSTDNGDTWEQCGGKFPSTVTDIATDIKSGKTNNTAIIAGEKLYYGNVIQSSTQVQNVAQEVGVE